MSGNPRSWTRLTPQPSDEDDLAGLRARVADPLWTLGRQWQVGDFAGEDGGSAVRVDAWIERDRVTHHDLGDGPVEYDPEERPLESVVEGEPVMTGDERPDMGVAVEAGLHFLRLLTRHGHRVDGDPPSADDLAEPYHLDESDYEAGVDVPESQEARRFELVTDGRAADGYEIYRGLVDEIPGLREAAGPGDVSWPGAGQLPVPGAAVDAAYEQAATDYVGWYDDQFDAPAGEDAWNESRLEYEARVSTGEGASETVYGVAEYRGGRLDWADFEVLPGESMTGGSGSAASGGVTETDVRDHASVRYAADPESASSVQGETVIERPDLSRMPSPVTFPGMPNSRWWEVEDGSVNVFGADLGPGELGKELLVDFAITYGDDWFTVPVETEVGTTQRVTALAVVDTFGAIEVAEPSLEAANEADEEPWKLFTDDLGTNHDEPGLFVPPTLADSFRSEPIERVVLARDELTNLAWAVEERILDPYGVRIEPDEFSDPDLRMTAVEADDDPADEHVEFENPGDEPIQVGDWELVVERATQSGTATETFAFGTDPEDVTVEPGSTLRVIPHVGDDTADELHWDWDDSPAEPPLLIDAESVVLRNGRGWPVGYRNLEDDRPVGNPAYRLASDVFDQWYPLQPRQTNTAAFSVGDTEFVLSRLVDADIGTLPTPKGRLLREYVPEEGGDPTVIHDEELTRAGVEVTRSYQLTRWLDGGAHTWSARRATTGRGQGSSGLRFDYLEYSEE